MDSAMRIAHTTLYHRTLWVIEASKLTLMYPTQFV